MIRYATPKPSAIGLGVYSFPDAARFIGAHTAELRRWMNGYSRKVEGESIEHPPLWESQLAESDLDGIGFRDLIELRFVKTFRDAGVSMNVIRKTLDAAKQQLSPEYPFTCREFQSDGKRIFFNVVEQSTGEESLIDPLKLQNVIKVVVGPSLRKRLKFDQTGAVSQWFPLENSDAVVLDPARSFGQPLLSDSGIPTAAIAAAVEAEGGNERRVARLFEVAIEVVRKALDFERQVALA
jgi:uncharacterized protein (DUF433 family)/DNA-binding transcriptional MerR regulator